MSMYKMPSSQKGSSGQSPTNSPKHVSEVTRGFINLTICDYYILRVNAFSTNDYTYY